MNLTISILNKLLKMLFLNLSIIIMISQLIINTQYAESLYIKQHQPSIADMIHGLNEEEIIIFNEELDADPRQLFQAVEAANPERNNQQVIESSQTNNALILFVLGRCALFIISQYGSTIIDYFFNLVHEAPEAIHHGIAGIIRLAADNGRMDAVYAHTASEAQRLLDDPNTASRVVNAFRAVNRRI